MKLSVLRFDDMVTVPGGKRIGDNMVGDACEATYRAADGWEITMVSPGVFTLQSECMPEAFTLGGYGYGYYPAPPPAPDYVTPVVTVDREELAQKYAKGKKR